MAASSSATATATATATTAASVVYPGRPYDVFLSFRGPDARYGFGDYLYRALTDADIKTFRDYEEIRTGYALGPEILEAVEQSKIAIPILSKGYAESKWCLRELAKISECQRKTLQKVIPVFYRVEQSKVKDAENGYYQEQINKHRKDENVTKIEEWKEAFAKIPETAEFELKEGDLTYEREVVGKVVEKVLSILEKRKERMPCILVGIDTHVRKLQKWVEKTKSIDVRVITIVGMSGIGKTTIARYVYNKLQNCFSSRICFLEDVAETSKRENGITELQSVLVSKITNSARKNFNNEHNGSQNIKDLMSKNKVFVVLDNVNSISQINLLLMGGKDALQRDCKSGSLFIITTTDKSILQPNTTTDENILPTSTTIDENTTKTSIVYRYNVERMEPGEALELFCEHAFQKKHPPMKFDKLTKDVVSSAGGLPLALVILGSYVSNEKGETSCEALLMKLISVPSMEVLNRLRIGYDALDVQQKQIFLDIACFFAGERKEQPIYMWEACGFHPEEGIEALKSRSLITIEDDNIIRMHDQLIQLGKQIVKEKVGEPYLKVPRKRSRIWDKHEALVTFRNHDKAAETVEVLNLKLEKIEEKQLAKHEQLGSFNRFKESSVPKNMYINYLGEEDFTHLPNLRFLRLGYAALDGDFRYLLSNLRWLEWSCHMKAEEDLPKTEPKAGPKARPKAGPKVVPKAVPLKINLKINLKNLVILDLSESNITDEWVNCMPFKVANKLKVLNLSRCKSLTKVPDGLTTLETLDISYCSIQNLDCSVVLTNLVNLKSSHCKDLKSLNLSNCTKLKTLSISGSKLTGIQNLENIKSLEVLHMFQCNGIEILPDLSNLRNLKKLSTSSCEKLREIKGLQGLVSIESMNLFYCCSLIELPELSKSTKPKKLSLQSCTSLSSIKGFGDLKYLQVLEMHNCKSISTVPSLSTAKKLTKLVLSSCAKLHQIDDFECLESLECLHMSQCKLIEQVARLPNPTKLKELYLSGCEKLSKIEGFSKFESLETLQISYCNKLIETMSLSTLTSLKSLSATNLNWTTITGLDEVKFLENLSTQDCKSLVKLPDFSEFPNLKYLNVAKCEKLTKIIGYKTLKKRKCKINLEGSGCK